MLTPMDIQNREFKTKLRGYSTEEVDEFLLEISREFEVLYRDNRELKDAVVALRDENEKYKNMEATMNNTLMLAQKTAEEVKVAARKEAELIVREANNQKDQMIRDTAQSLIDGHEKYETIRNDVAVFRAKVESLLNSQLKLLTEMELPQIRESIFPNTAEKIEVVEENVEVAE